MINRVLKPRFRISRSARSFLLSIILRDSKRTTVKENFERFSIRDTAAMRLTSKFR